MHPTALSEALLFLDSWLQRRASEVDLPGFSVAVLNNDNPVWTRAYGEAHSTFAIPMNTSHLFGIGSQSKMLTMTALLQLVEKQELRLDDPICQYLPWIKAHPSNELQHATLRHLLSHSSGIMRDGMEYWQQTSVFPTTEQLPELILGTRLGVEGNTHMKYSNLGYALLGQVIELVSEMSFTEYIATYIAKPLDITNLYGDMTDDIGAQIAAGYSIPHARKRLPAPELTFKHALAAAAGAIANPSAMCQFVSGHFSDNTLLLGNFLKKEARRSQWVVTKGYSRGFEYGLGLEIIDAGGWRLYGHGGTLDGYRTATFFEPNKRIAVSVSANCKDAPAMAMIRGIFNTLIHFQRTATAPTPRQLRRFNGYFSNTQATFEVVTTKGAMLAIDPSDWDPLSWGEQLGYVDPSTLRVQTSGSVHSEGEELRYHFKKRRAPEVTYNGMRFKKGESIDPAISDIYSAYTLPAQDAHALFQHYFKSTKHFFHLEVLPEYTHEEIIGSDSLQAWLQGKYRQSIALIEERIREETCIPPTIKLGIKAFKQAHSAIRVRLTDDEVTPYMQWEAEYFKRLHTPIHRERILYLPKKYLRDIPIPAGDVLVYDNVIIINGYQNGEITRRTFYNNLQSPEALQVINIKDQVLQMAYRHRNTASPFSY